MIANCCTVNVATNINSSIHVLYTENVNRCEKIIMPFGNKIGHFGNACSITSNSWYLQGIIGLLRGVVFYMIKFRIRIKRGKRR
jgi:hypothetical protein